MKDILLALVKNEAFMNALITLIAAIASWLIARMFTAKPEWAKYEGFMIDAIKTAEKLIPDDSGDTSVAVERSSIARADAALKKFIESYTNSYGKMPTKEVIDVVKQAIPIIHDHLEAEGNL